MNRTRVVFVVIILMAVFIIFGALFVQLIGNLVDGGSSAQSEEPTPLPAGTVLVSVASSNTKQNWMDQIVEQFNAAGFETSGGDTIVAEVAHVTSGGSMNAILDGNLAPVAWSPGDASWVEQINTTWQQRFNRPINSEVCQATIYAPLGFAMWRPMAEALGWPDTPIGWDTIVEARDH
jgi:Ca-activated chloride channel family protein